MEDVAVKTLNWFIFFGLVTPLAFVLRICRWKCLTTGFDEQCQTYWTPRKPETTGTTTLKQQR
jgi:hypothetical protein